MKRQVMIVALAVSIPAVAGAQSNHSNTCTSGNLTRRVEIAYSGAADVPCEVRYFKEGDASPQVLWSATTESGYCESQARDFISKLQGMGWVCSDSGTASPQSTVAAPRPSDDTEVLEAGGKR
jgi:hypothetical protein